MIIAHQPVPLAVRGRLSSQFRSDSRPSDGQIFRPSDGQTFPDRPISFITNLLRTLCRHQKSQLLCNQANPNSFCKTPGVGVPSGFSPCLRRAGGPVPLTTFRMNTYKSVSKQRTLTPFRMNTCEKPGGRGAP